MSYMEEIDLPLVWTLLVLHFFYIGTIGRVPICLIRPHMRKQERHLAHLAWPANFHCLWTWGTWVQKNVLDIRSWISKSAGKDKLLGIWGVALVFFSADTNPHLYCDRQMLHAAQLIALEQRQHWHTITFGWQTLLHTIPSFWGDFKKRIIMQLTIK